MRPDQLIGLGYRLGADPEVHGVTDCLGLTRAVLAYYGIKSPTPTRQWYRRLRRGDTSIFWEELRQWGVEIDTPRMGSVALCQGVSGYGLAVWWLNGWLSYRENIVCWSPRGSLVECAIFFPSRLNCAICSK